MVLLALSDLDAVGIAHTEPLLRHGRDHIVVALDLVLVVDNVCRARRDPCVLGVSSVLGGGSNRWSRWNHHSADDARSRPSPRADRGGYLPRRSAPLASASPRSFPTPTADHAPSRRSSRTPSHGSRIELTSSDASKSSCSYPSYYNGAVEPAPSGPYTGSPESTSSSSKLTQLTAAEAHHETHPCLAGESR